MAEYRVKWSPMVLELEERHADEALAEGMVHLTREQYSGELEVTSSGALIFRDGKGVIRHVIASNAYIEVFYLGE